MNYFDSAQNNLENALKARKSGFEGRARVLCRLAAASAIQDHLKTTGQTTLHGNAVEVIGQYAAETEDLPVFIKDALLHLSMRVDANYNLPTGIDLIQDVRRLFLFFKDKNGR